MATAPFSAPFIPAQPPRTPDYIAAWRGFVGERMRNAIYGLPEPAFDSHYNRRESIGLTFHGISDPVAVERVMLTNKANYQRPRLARRILAPLVGNGLLSAEGDDWRVQRRIVAPTFAPAAVARMAETMDTAAAADLAHWPGRSGRYNIVEATTRTTMAIIADSLFAGDARLTNPAASRHIEQLIVAAGQTRLSSIFGFESWDFTPTMQRARTSRTWMRDTLTQLVHERGPDGGPEGVRDDFFGGLIRALHAQFPPDEAATLAVDNAITFYVAGHETTANALAWTLYCLAGLPALQDEARAEAVAAMGYSPAERFDQLPLLRQILDEAMRLYPPAPRLVREAEAADELCGRAIAPGDLVMIWPYIIHRHRKLWENPDRFDHTRFAPAAKAALHRFQYIPFGGGPRVCVGARFATMEAVLILARWLTQRRFALPAGFRPDPVGSVTLRPRGGMALMVEPA